MNLYEVFIKEQDRESGCVKYHKTYVSCWTEEKASTLAKKKVDESSTSIWESEVVSILHLGEVLVDDSI